MFHKAAGSTNAAEVAVEVNVVTNPEHVVDVLNRFVDPDAVRVVNPSKQVVCETVNGVPVPERVLLHGLVHGNIRRVLTDSAGRAIDLGRRQRLFTGAAREAVLLLGDRCSFPGCDVAFARMHIDHVHPYAQQGSTTPSNGAVMCPAHNQLKHQHQITVTRDHTGWPQYRPDGTEITPRWQWAATDASP